MDRDPLEVDEPMMREMGYRVVDLLAERMAQPGAAPALRRAGVEEMQQLLDEPPPEEPAGFDELFRRLTRDVLPFASRPDHPGYLAFIPSAGTWLGALGDFIASGWNVYAGSWMESAGPSQLELTVLDWFRRWIGYPEGASGVLVSGGSAANITALACAREALLGPMTDSVVAYVADQAHSSMARAARVLGFRPDQLRVLPADDGFRLVPGAVESAMEADLAAGRRPLFVSATAGATNTGVVDPLTELAAICRDRGVWFHVDAAYGGFAALTERGRAQLGGIELADSVTLDPHKWLYQPFECGSLLVRDGPLLRRAFEITPDYLRDAQVHGREVNFADMGIQLTRTTRALKVWLSLKFFGVGAFRQAIDRCMDIALAAQRRIEQSERLELLNPTSLSIVCFRRRFEGVEEEATLDHMNAELVRGLEENGIGLISSTRLHGRYALRLCILNHTTGPADVDRVLDWLEEAEISVPAVPAPQPVPGAGGFERDPDIDRGWVRRSRLTAQSLAEVPLFQALSPEQLERAGGSAREVDVRQGETVVRKWEYSRDFYLILSGTARVSDEGKHIGDLGPGEFFGELAALEWGAGYSYPRLATVTAVTDLRLLVLPAEELNHLVKESPEVEEAVRRAASERLTR